MFKLSAVVAALALFASSADAADKFVLNKMPAKNVTFDKAILKPTFNKSDVKALLPDIPAIKGDAKNAVADKLASLTNKIDVMEHMAKTEALVLPNKTAIIAKLEAFKGVIAAEVNATIHKKDVPAPTNPV